MLDMFPFSPCSVSSQSCPAACRGSPRSSGAAWAPLNLRPPSLQRPSAFCTCASGRAQHAEPGKGMATLVPSSKHLKIHTVTLIISWLFISRDKSVTYNLPKMAWSCMVGILVGGTSLALSKSVFFVPGLLRQPIPCISFFFQINLSDTNITTRTVYAYIMINIWLIYG